MERTILTKREEMGSKWGTTFLKNKCERLYKNRRKHYVAFHERNQGERNSSWRRMPVSEVLDMPAWLKTIPIKRYSKNRKRTPSWCLAQKFSSRNSKCPCIQKNSWRFTWHFSVSAHILWEATMPTIVLTDIKSATRFLQTKAIPPALWNECDYVLWFYFKKNTFCRFSQNCGWLSLQTGTQSHR